MTCICSVPNICIFLSNFFLVGNGYGFKAFLKMKITFMGQWLSHEGLHSSQKKC